MGKKKIKMIGMNFDNAEMMALRSRHSEVTNMKNKLDYDVKQVEELSKELIEKTSEGRHDIFENSKQDFESVGEEAATNAIGLLATVADLLPVLSLFKTTDGRDVSEVYQTEMLALSHLAAAAVIGANNIFKQEDVMLLYTRDTAENWLRERLISVSDRTLEAIDDFVKYTEEESKRDLDELLKCDN